MKSFKAVFFVIVVLLFSIVVVQNWEVLKEPKVVEVNLGVWDYKTQGIPVAVYFLGFFLIGLLVSYFCGLSERFKAKRAAQSQLETIRKLEEEIKVLKSLPADDETTSPKKSESV